MCFLVVKESVCHLKYTRKITSNRDASGLHDCTIGLAWNSEGSEGKLIESLFANYSKNQRPSTPAIVSLHMVVLNIDEVVSDRIEAKTIANRHP